MFNVTLFPLENDGNSLNAFQQGQLLTSCGCNKGNCWLLVDAHRFTQQIPVHPLKTKSWHGERTMIKNKNRLQNGTYKLNGICRVIPFKKKFIYITDKSCMSTNVAINGFLWRKQMTVPLWNYNSKILHPFNHSHKFLIVKNMSIWIFNRYVKLPTKKGVPIQTSLTT